MKVYPKVKLGSELITDYVVKLAEREYVLVEIEPPGHKLFNVNGDPSAKLTHAEQQIYDWQEWMRDSIAYARQNIEELSDVHDPDYLLVIGRRPRSKRDQTALLRRNRSANFTLLTYDDLIDRALRLHASLKRHARRSH